MIEQIKTVADVKTFFNELYGEDLNFHPDDDFSNYINTENGEPTYSQVQAAIRNSLLDQAFLICDKECADIYELCIEIFMKDFYE